MGVVPKLGNMGIFMKAAMGEKEMLDDDRIGMLLSDDLLETG